MSEYSVEEVRAMASDLRGAPGTSMIGTHISLPTARAVAIYEALCAYAERIKADARPVAQGESAWLERLKDPATVHALMLRGVIAVPSVRSMVDLRGEVPNGEDVQLLRIAELQEQLAAQPRAVPAESTPRGTFECPICGYDKPHHHTGREASIRWHSDYRKAFEEIVHKNLHLVRMQGLFFGRQRAMHLWSEGSIHFLGYGAEDARKHVGTEHVVGMPNHPWSEFGGGATRNGGYKQPWLDDLWSVFRQFVVATRADEWRGRALAAEELCRARAATAKAAAEPVAQGEADELISAYDEAVRRQRESGFQPPAAQQAARACVEHNRNRLRKVLAGQPRAVPDGWSSIESAPNDGTPHVRGLHVFSSDGGLRPYWDAVVGRIDQEDGQFYDLSGDLSGWGANDFTHWHPLAATPSRGESA